MRKIFESSWLQASVEAFCHERVHREKKLTLFADKNNSNCGIHQERILPCIDNTFVMMSNLKITLYSEGKNCTSSLCAFKLQYTCKNNQEND
jgi:hypothetical protein